MSLLSPRLQLKVAQKQILTPGLVQMVTVLQLNRLELKEMITQEIVKNPVLEESTEEPGEEITPEELLPLLEAERVTDPADRQILEAGVLNEANSLDGDLGDVAINGNLFPDAEETAAAAAAARDGDRQRSAAGAAGGHRPVRRNRFRLVLRRLPGSRATRARPRNRSKSLRSKPSSRPPSRWAIICARN